MADQELIEAARRGDEQALVRLLVVCQPDLRRYARRTCANEDIEESIQDALLILYKRLGSLRTIAKFSGWLYQIVKRACLKRMQGRAISSHDDEAMNNLKDPTDIELQMDLSRSIASLPLIYREVVILRDVNGCSAEEVAHELGVSIEALKSRLHRGRYLIRQMLS